MYICGIIQKHPVMKKLYLSFALILWSCVHIAEAQNMYRNYQSSSYAVPHPTSAVSLVHSNGYVYFFQADEIGKLSATEIDPLSMLPTGNAYFFAFPQNYYFHAKGGFEDAGGNFIIFGNYYNTILHYQHPAYIRITSNLSSCDVYYDQNSTYGEFTAGCDGYNQNMLEAYMFVNGQDLVAVDPTNPSTMNYRAPDAVLNPSDYFTDISWDATHSMFIATGNARNASLGIKDPFVEVFTLVNYNNIVPNAAYCVLNQTFIYPSEFNSLHVQIDNDNLILYHNLRYSDNTSIYDNIWLTRIKNYWNYNTASVSESWIYKLPNSKLFDKDMLYDPYNNRLNFLGEFNKCREGTIQLLAQIDPFSLSSGIEIGQLGAGFMGGVCFNDQPPYVDLAYNDLEMSNLTLDIKNPCHPVLIAGVGNKMSILTETYDISLSKCDVPMWHEDKQVNPILKPYSLNTLPLSPPVYHVLINGYTDPITTNYICDEPEACSHQFGGKSLQQPLVGNPTAKITVESGRQFVCEGFEGVIQYSLYDMAGRLLQQGETCNGKYNSLKMHSGAYLLKATDATGRQMVKKIILY